MKRDTEDNICYKKPVEFTTGFSVRRAAEVVFIFKISTAGRCRLESVVFGTKFAYHGAGLPHLAVAQIGQLFCKAFAIIGPGVAVD